MFSVSGLVDIPHDPAFVLGFHGCCFHSCGAGFEDVGPFLRSFWGECKRTPSIWGFGD